MYVLISILLTTDFGFSATETLSSLELVAAGLSKEKLAQLQVPMIPVKIGVTLLLSRFAAGKRPMNLWLVAFPLRLLMCLAFTALVFLTPIMKLEDGTFSSFYYFLFITVSVIHSVPRYAMFLGLVAFFTKISDPAVGGTYMTLLAAFANLGAIWPNSFSLWVVDKIYGGLYTISIVSVVIGAVSFICYFRTIRKFQDLNNDQWRVVDRKVKKEEEVDDSKYFHSSRRLRQSFASRRILASVKL